MPRQIRTDWATFLGVNLTRDRLSLSDEELAVAINADLAALPGVIQRRRGRRTLWTTALALWSIRRLARCNGARYQVAEQTLYRNRGALDTTLHGTQVTTFVAARPLNDSTTWLFIGDNALMRKDDGSHFSAWGLAAPATAPSSLSETGYWTFVCTQPWEETDTGIATPMETFTLVGSGSAAFVAASRTGWRGTQAWEVQTPGLTGAVLACFVFERAWLSSTTPHFADATLPHTGLTGTYGVAYTYVRKVGDKIAHESNPSATTSTTVTGWVGALRYTVTASTDEQVTHMRCYRTLTGGSTLLYDQEVSNTTQTVTTSQADTSLGAAVETDNDPPPSLAWVTSFQQHIFGCRDVAFPHYLYYSKRFRPEAWPTDQFLELGDAADPLQCAVPLAGLLGVWTRQTKYRVFGNDASGFTALEALSRRGTLAPQAVVPTARGAVFPAADGLWLTNFVQPDQELSARIAPLFHGETVNDYAPIDPSRSAEMSAAVWHERLYVGYVDTAGTRMLAVLSFATGHWYFWAVPCTCLLVEEDLDQLVMGSTDGFAYVLEDPAQPSDAGSPIALTVETAERGDRAVRQRFEWLRVDADVPSGTLTATVLVDNVARATVAITGRRTRRLLRLPGSLLGFTVRVRVQYTGTAAVQIYGVSLLGQALEGR